MLKPRLRSSLSFVLVLSFAGLTCLVTLYRQLNSNYNISVTQLNDIYVQPSASLLDAFHFATDSPERNSALKLALKKSNAPLALATEQRMRTHDYTHPLKLYNLQLGPPITLYQFNVTATAQRNLATADSIDEHNQVSTTTNDINFDRAMPSFTTYMLLADGNIVGLMQLRFGVNNKIDSIAFTESEPGWPPADFVQLLPRLAVDRRIVSSAYELRLLELISQESNFCLDAIWLKAKSEDQDLFYLFDARNWHPPPDSFPLALHTRDETLAIYISLARLHPANLNESLNESYIQ